MSRVGLYLGTADDPVENIVRVLTDWGRYIGENVDLEVFGSASPPPNLSEYYNEVRITPRKSKTPFGKIFNSYRDGVEYINKRNPDVLISPWKYHTHAPGIALAGWRTDIPTVTRITGDVYEEYKHYQGAKRVGIFFLDNILGHIPPKLSNKMIALGPYEKSQVTNRGMPQNDVTLLPPPKPTSSRFSPPDDKSKCKNELDLPPDVPIGLFVGRITEEKGMPFLVDVINAVLAEMEMMFILVGEGPFSSKLEGQFNENVILPGQIPHNQIDLYYKAADVYVHPSPYEGIPLVILEALSCNLPVVSRPAGDIPFILSDSNIATSPEEMANKLLAGQISQSSKNSKYFTESYQKQALNEIVSGLLPDAEH